MLSGVWFVTIVLLVCVLLLRLDLTDADISNVSLAISEGVDVKGYFAW